MNNKKEPNSENNQRLRGYELKLNAGRLEMEALGEALPRFRDEAAAQATVARESRNVAEAAHRFATEEPQEFGPDTELPPDVPPTPAGIPSGNIPEEAQPFDVPQEAQPFDVPQELATPSFWSGLLDTSSADTSANLAYLLSRGIPGLNPLLAGISLHTMHKAWVSLSRDLQLAQRFGNAGATDLLSRGYQIFSKGGALGAKGLAGATLAYGMYEFFGQVYSWLGGLPEGQDKDKLKRAIDSAVGQALPRNATQRANAGGATNQSAIEAAYIAQATGDIQRASRSQYIVRGNRGVSVVRPQYSGGQIMI